MASLGPTTITKLTHGNYSEWKFAMKLLLINRELWGIVSGVTPIPEEAASEAEKTRYELRQDKALSTIGLGVSTDLHHLIVDSKDAKEAWETLKTAFEPKSRVRILQLKRSLVNIRLQEAESMQDYLGRVTTVVRDLKEADAEVKDSDVAYTMMAGLPESYDGVVMQFNAVEDNKFTSLVVRQALVTEYERRSSRGQQVKSEDPEMAYQASPKADGARGVPDRRPQRQPAKQQARGKFMGACFKCGVRGHRAKDCREKDQRRDGTSKTTGTGQRDGRSSESNLTDGYFTALHPGVLKRTDWLVDSGCTSHITNCRNWFTSFTPMSAEITLGEGNSKVEGYGNIVFESVIDGSTFRTEFRNVLYAPGMRRNLLSASKIEKHGYSIQIANGSLRIYNPDLQLVGIAPNKCDLFVLEGKVLGNFESGLSQFASPNLELWHKRFCHVNKADIVKMAKKDSVRGLEKVAHDKSSELCQDCELGKSTKQSHVSQPKGVRNSDRVLRLVHSDLWGPAPVGSLSNARYILTFIDDFSRKATIYFLKQKSQVAEKFTEYRVMVERQTGLKLAKLRTDNGLKFCNTNLDGECRKLGIRHERTNVFSPQMNGVAERYNRTLMDLVVTSLKSSKLPKHLWAEAANAVNHVKSRTPHSSVPEGVPDFVWYGRQPSVAYIKAFGCVGYVHIPKQKRSKLDPKAEPLVLVGYAMHTRGYRMWEPGTKRVVETKHVRFDESKIGIGEVREDRSEELVSYDYEERGWNRELGGRLQRNEVVTPKRDSSDSESDQDLPNTQPKVPRPPAKKVRSGNAVEDILRNRLNSKGEGSPGSSSNFVGSIGESNFCDIVIPQSYEEALSLPETNKWEEAMSKELDCHQERETWSLEEVPRGSKLVSCRWVYSVKRDITNAIVKFKARLVARGFSQREGIDYEDTYSPNHR